MSLRWINWKIWLLSAVIIAASIWIVGSSEAFQYCIQQSYAESSGHEPEKGLALFLSLLERRQACTGAFLEENGGAITAFFTIVLAISTIALWGATMDAARGGERAANIAEQSLVDLQRAFVVPDTGKINQYVGPGPALMGYHMSFKMKNIGKTVAKNYVSTANLVFTDGEDFPENFDYPDMATPHRPVFMGPEGTNVMPFRISMDDMINIAAKKRRGFIYGWVEYDDIFSVGQKRRTEFCSEIDAFGDVSVISRPGMEIPIRSSHYGAYNNIDEGCLYKPGERPPKRSRAELFNIPDKDTSG